MNINRRKAIKLIGVSSLALSINPFSGCENPIDYNITNQNNIDDKNNAIMLIDKFCQDNLAGNFNYKISSIEKHNNSFSPAFDFLAVVESYKIIKTTQIKDITYVFVKYNYVGCHKGNKFHLFNSSNKSNYIIAKYKVKNNILINGRFPVLHTSIYKRNLQRSIASAKSIIDKTPNSSSKEHFEKKIEYYNNIITLIS